MLIESRKTRLLICLSDCQTCNTALACDIGHKASLFARRFPTRTQRWRQKREGGGGITFFSLNFLSFLILDGML